MRRTILALLLFSVVLPLHAAITGTVMNPDGQAIAGARVEIFTLEAIDAARARLLSATPARTPLKAAVTDAKGKFTLESPKDAVVQLHVSATGFAPDFTRVERDEDLGAIALVP